MKDELTTLTHSEFIGDEIPLNDLIVLSVFGAMARGMSKEDALKKYEIDVVTYDGNIERCLKS